MKYNINNDQCEECGQYVNQFTDGCPAVSPDDDARVVCDKCCESLPSTEDGTPITSE